MSYDTYDREYEEIFAIEDSQRAFEEEVLVTGFGGAPTKTEGQALPSTMQLSHSPLVTLTTPLRWHSR